MFSPGGSARTLAGGVRYHRDGEKRVVFLHLAPSPPTPLEGAGDLRELLFMFSVSVYNRFDVDHEMVILAVKEVSAFVLP